jgi:hypothetical protein
MILPNVRADARTLTADLACLTSEHMHIARIAKGTPARFCSLCPAERLQCSHSTGLADEHRWSSDNGANLRRVARDTAKGAKDGLIRTPPPKLYTQSPGKVVEAVEQVIERIAVRIACGSPAGHGTLRGLSVGRANSREPRIDGRELASECHRECSYTRR